jgi:hypothetical protein
MDNLPKKKRDPFGQPCDTCTALGSITDFKHRMEAIKKQQGIISIVLVLQCQ